MAGLSLIAAGLGTAVFRPTVARLGNLAILAGLGWFAPVWIGWQGGPTLIRSLAMLAGGLVVPLLLHILLAYPGGRLTSAPARTLIRLVYLEAGLSALGRALFYDPFADPNCWANCTDNLFLVRSLPGLTGAIAQFDLGFVVVAAIAVLCAQLWQLQAAAPPTRRSLWPAVPAGIALAAGTGGRAAELVRIQVENPANAGLRTAFVVFCAAALFLAGSLGWAVQQASARRRAMAGVVADLSQAPRPGTLQPVLARAVGDPELSIAYLLPASGRFSDSRGRRIEEPIPTPTRSVTPLVRAGLQVASITSTAPAPELERGLTPAIRLAVENEVLQVHLHAQLNDLQASQARIVATGDARRRRLERDLHDGAQQHLVALTYALRLARAQAAADDDDVAALLAQAAKDAQATLDDLRDLASGVFPVLLAEAGLAAAIAGLADRAAIPVEIGDLTTRRFSASVESAGYLVVTEGIEQAELRGASYAAVTGASVGDRLVISVSDDGIRPPDPMIHVFDRVGALGGSVQIQPGMLRAEIPCG